MISPGNPSQISPFFRGFGVVSSGVSFNDFSRGFFKNLYWGFLQGFFCESILGSFRDSTWDFFNNLSWKHAINYIGIFLGIPAANLFEVFSGIAL